VTEGFGLFPTIVKPPYTTLTAYDLNAGTIRWQIPLGDDPRLAAQGITGTGAAMTTKGGMVVTATGLLFATTADRKVHVYDTASGRQLHELPLGGATSAGPSMFESNGRQYLVVTASASGGGRGGRGTAAPQPGAATGPTGIIAYALPE
jgi:quinoprotein glucose dehydrogenase